MHPPDPPEAYKRRFYVTFCKLLFLWVYSVGKHPYIFIERFNLISQITVGSSNRINQPQRMLNDFRYVMLFVVREKCVCPGNPPPVINVEYYFFPFVP